MIIIDDIEQRTAEWDEIRAGIPTASEFSRIVKANGDPSTSRVDYMNELAGERITGAPEEGYTSYHMLKGIEREDKARVCYEFMTDHTVQEVGFVFKDEDRRVGCSPDGFVIDPTGMNELYTEKGLEIKCPKLKTHIAQLLNGGLPPDKYQQVQGCMWVCGFHSWDFISFFPDTDPYITTIERDYKFTSNLESEMIMFLDELDEVYDKLKERE